MTAMVVPDSRYYVHASTQAAKAQQEYLRDIANVGVSRAWVLLAAAVILAAITIWLLTR